MFIIKAKDKEYKIKFTMRAYAESDLMDRVKDLLSDNDDVVAGVKKFASTIVELLYVGAQKYNPFEDKDSAYDFLDDYIDERKEAGEKDIVMNLFQQFAKDLQDEGFLGDLLKTMSDNNKVKRVSQKKN